MDFSQLLHDFQIRVIDHPFNEVVRDFIKINGIPIRPQCAGTVISPYDGIRELPAVKVRQRGLALQRYLIVAGFGVKLGEYLAA